jgi:hypothetical protein
MGRVGCCSDSLRMAWVLLPREIPVAVYAGRGMIETRNIKLPDWRCWRVAGPQAEGPSRDVSRRDR